jgi:hypothetical protein
MRTAVSREKRRGASVKNGLLAFLLLLHPALASAQEVVSPEAVRLENVRLDGEMKTVRVGNARAHYLLFCNPKLDSCLTPKQGQKYFLVDQNTHAGAKDFPTLAFLQDLLGKYDSATSEHIGLVSDGGGLGLYLLDRSAGGYQPDTILYDGPIFYGTGMKDADRQRVWKTFFLKMVEAVLRQQGKEALEAKITPRCFPGEDYCTTTLDANFVGVGGGKEPRKVLVFVTHDIRDPRMEFSRVVCTWPIGERVCKDWSTGKFRADLE